MSFQSRLKIVLQTLAIAVPELIHLLIIIVILTMMWAVLAHILFGWRREKASTLQDALYWSAASMLDPNRTSVSAHV